MAKVPSPENRSAIGPAINGDDLLVDWDGGVEVWYGPEQHTGNWIKTSPGPQTVVIRQFFGRWDTEEPMRLRIERVDATGAPPPPSPDGVIHKLSRYRFVPSAQPASAHGVVVMRVTVARDGSVLEVALLRSSGFPTLDQGLPGRVYVSSKTGHHGMSDNENPFRHPGLPIRPSIVHVVPIADALHREERPASLYSTKSLH